MLNKVNLFIFFVILIIKTKCHKHYCEKTDLKCEPEKNKTNNRYLFYDVNPPEGFNARRDVYMRFAILAHKMVKLKKFSSFKLVLPPWSFLLHWQYKEEPERLPWGRFFDLESMKFFAPVVEMFEFFQDLPRNYKKVKIDQVYILQHYEDMFETGNFEERMEIGKCQRKPHLNYYFYENITSDNIQCLSFHGSATKLKEIISKTEARTILFHHAEVALHEYFGNNLYWQCRRSMRFNKELIEIANDYRRKYLNSSDIEDNTVLPKDWRDEKPQRTSKGGPFLAVHLRRRDFIKVRSKEIPTVDSIIVQIKQLLKKLSLKKVFIATDDDESLFETLTTGLPSIELYRYEPEQFVIDKYGDGGVAIIDQIICSHARHFVGTHESTFSFRIQEEREIMGFPIESTFNSLCRDKTNCEKPSAWKIVY